MENMANANLENVEKQDWAELTYVLLQKPYKCDVPGCQKRYTDPSSLRKHVKNHSREEQEQAMAMVGKQFQLYKCKIITNYIKRKQFPIIYIQMTISLF